MKFYRLIIAATLLAFVVWLTSCSSYMTGSMSTSSASMVSGDINIMGMAFTPSTFTTNVGSTIKWANNDSITHTVTSVSGPASFNSGNLTPGATYSFTFTMTGTYSYHCSIHPSMTGTITITP